MGRVTGWRQRLARFFAPHYPPASRGSIEAFPSGLFNWGWQTQVLAELRGRVCKGWLGQSADAGSCRKRRRRFSDGLIHDLPDGAGATPAFGAASQTPIDLAGRPDSALVRNRSDLMVRNDVTRTHDHDSTPGSIRCFMFSALAASASSGWQRYACHL